MRHTLTDEEGWFEFVDLPDGDYTVGSYVASEVIERTGIRVTQDRGAVVHVRFTSGYCVRCFGGARRR